MKRFLSILAAVCLLGSVFCGSVKAESTAKPLRVFAIGPHSPEEFAALHPDLPVTLVKVTYDSQGLSNKDALLLAGDWDVATVDVGSRWANAVTLRELYSRGLALDLSRNPALAPKAESLFPAIRQAVTVNGVPVALPFQIYRSVMQMQITTWPEEAQSTFARLGFAPADAPHTFHELADLPEAYMALPVETRRGTAFSVSYLDSTSSSAYPYYLYYLIELYTAEFCDASGAVDYDTPAFRAALDDLERLADALAQDPKVRYAGDGSLTGLLQDASRMLGGSCADRRNLNLYIENSEAIPAHMRVLVINPNTPQMEQALRYVSIIAEESAARFHPLLYVDAAPAALAKQAYETELAELQSESGNVDPTYVETFIKTYANDPDAFFARNYYTQEQLADYRQHIAPRLTFPPIPLVNANTAAETFLHSNTLDAEGLIRHLNDEAAK